MAVDLGFMAAQSKFLTHGILRRYISFVLSHTSGTARGNIYGMFSLICLSDFVRISWRADLRVFGGARSSLSATDANSFSVTVR
jgi:hypothetical protein